MMSSGIFISYSHQDYHEAIVLRDILRSKGYDVWIDQDGIEAATAWSAEIVENIVRCDLFLVLLSRSAVRSQNVLKEISLAFEHGKLILPVDIEPVALPPSIEYSLAGVHRVAFVETDRILRGIEHHFSVDHVAGEHSTEARRARKRKNILAGTVFLILIVIGLVYWSAGGASIGVSADERPLVAVLSFSVLNLDEDSSTDMNIFSEAIRMQLASLGSFRLCPRTSTAGFVGRRSAPTTAARELGCRYLVQGTARKIQGRLELLASVFDADLGNECWETMIHGNARQAFELSDSLAGALAAYLDSKRRDETVVAEALAHVKETPALPDPSTTLGVFWQFSNPIRSVEYFEIARRADSLNPFVGLNLAIEYCRLRKRERALATAISTLPRFEYAYRNHPNDPVLVAGYARLCQIAGDTLTANTVAAKMLAGLGHLTIENLAVSSILFAVPCYFPRRQQIDPRREQDLQGLIVPPTKADGHLDQTLSLDGYSRAYFYYQLACIALERDEQGAAVVFLDSSIRNQPILPEFLESDPSLDPLRSSRKFHDLLHRN